MNNKGIDGWFESYDFLSEIILLDIFSQDRLKDASVVLKEFLIKEAKEPNTFYRKEHIILIFRLYRRTNQILADRYQVLVVDISSTLLEEDQAKI